MKILSMQRVLPVISIALMSALLPASAGQKPNVVLIVCDDLNDYITGIPGQTGHRQSITPHVEKLAKSGVAFRRAYSNNPVCAPSRSSFLTGIYPHTSLNLFWDKWYENPVLSNCKTVMEYFRDNGYHIAGTGKLMHHHWPEAWSGGEYENKTDYGPYWFDGKKRVANPSVPRPFADIGCIDGSYGPLGPVPKGQPAGAGWKYGWGQEQLLDFTGKDRDLTPDELNAKWAVEKIRQFDRQKKPFFLAVGFVRPHTPLHVPQEYFDLYPMDQIELPLIKPGDVADTHYREVFTDEIKGLRYHRTLGASYPDLEAGLKAFTRAYLACVTAVDECIGQVVEALDHSGMKENTIVVVTSDHGWQMGQKDYVFKNSPWEESARIPLIIRAPGVSRAGGVAEHPVSLIDIYPTLVDLCGLEGDTRKNDKGVPLDGYSVRPFLEDPENRKWAGPEAALTMVFAGECATRPLTAEDKKDPWMQHWSLRTERYRYIRYNNGSEELYDHDADPNEWSNLADHPEYAEVKAGLIKLLRTALPSRQESASKAKAISDANGERWKDKYFGMHPDADADGDGVLTWSEYSTHRAKLDAAKTKP